MLCLVFVFVFVLLRLEHPAGWICAHYKSYYYYYYLLKYSERRICFTATAPVAWMNLNMGGGNMEDTGSFSNLRFGSMHRMMFKSPPSAKQTLLQNCTGLKGFSSCSPLPRVAFSLVQGKLAYTNNNKYLHCTTTCMFLVNAGAIPLSAEHVYSPPSALDTFKILSRALPSEYSIWWALRSNPSRVHVMKLSGLGLASASHTNSLIEWRLITIWSPVEMIGESGW